MKGPQSTSATPRRARQFPVIRSVYDFDPGSARLWHRSPDRVPVSPDLDRRAPAEVSAGVPSARRRSPPQGEATGFYALNPRSLHDDEVAVCH